MTNTLPTQTPRILSSHTIADRFEVDRFLTRFDATAPLDDVEPVTWIVSDRSLGEDDLGLAPVIYQGPLSGAKRAIRRALAGGRS